MSTNPGRKPKVDPTLLTQAQFATLTGRTRSAVAKWLRRGTIRGDALVTAPNGKKLLRRDLALAQLRHNRDLGQSLGNGIKTRTHLGPATRPVVDSGVNTVDPFASVALASNEADRKAMTLGLALVYALPAIVADLAVNAGADLRIAYALRSGVSLALMYKIEGLLERMGVDLTGDIGYDLDAIEDLDWASLSKERGEQFDVEGWKAAAACFDRGGE